MSINFSACLVMGDAMGALTHFALSPKLEKRFREATKAACGAGATVFSVQDDGLGHLVSDDAQTLVAHMRITARALLAVAAELEPKVDADKLFAEMNAWSQDNGATFTMDETPDGRFRSVRVRTESGRAGIRMRICRDTGELESIARMIGKPPERSEEPTLKEARKRWESFVNHSEASR